MSRIRQEIGAAAVETAFLITLVLLPLVIGTVEFGFAFNEWQSVATATREGARAGSAAGPRVDDPSTPAVDEDADCITLEATAGALTTIDGDAVSEVWIFRADADGNPGPRNRYRPKVDTDDPTSVFCNRWVRIGAAGWPVPTRDNTVPNRANLGVRVIFDHAWVTGLPPFTGTVQWRNDTVMRIEPEADF